MATQKDLQSNTYHRIGSVTKTFVATAVLQLAEQGKLSLDDPIDDYVAPQELLDQAYSMPTSFPPGTNMQHSNTNYVLLGPTGNTMPSPHVNDYTHMTNQIVGATQKNAWTDANAPCLGYCPSILRCKTRQRTQRGVQTGNLERAWVMHHRDAMPVHRF